LNLKFGINPGEGAFYGPKLEFVLKDAIGRDWQCGTVQVDLNLPEAFDISYVTESGERKRPVMFHRAIFGSLERFIGILVEHHTGKLPAWLSPVQVVTLNISEGQKEYAEEVFAALKKAGLRAEIDLSNEKIGYKIREHTLKRTPLMLILGEKEKLEKKVTVRERNGKELGQVELNTLPSFLQQYIATNRE
jgi:threonyl-tRNA synthetase